MNETIQETLKQRGNVHGDFWQSAATRDAMMSSAEHTPNYYNMEPAQRRSISMIIEKMARILWGDANCADHWHDIAGYAALIDNKISTSEER